MFAADSRYLKSLAASVALRHCTPNTENTNDPNTSSTTTRTKVGSGGEVSRAMNQQQESIQLDTTQRTQGQRRAIDTFFHGPAASPIAPAAALNESTATDLAPSSSIISNPKGDRNEVFDKNASGQQLVAGTPWFKHLFPEKQSLREGRKPNPVSMEPRGASTTSRKSEGNPLPQLEVPQATPRPPHREPPGIPHPSSNSRPQQPTSVSRSPQPRAGSPGSVTSLANGVQTHRRGLVSPPRGRDGPPRYTTSPLAKPASPSRAEHVPGRAAPYQPPHTTVNLQHSAPTADTTTTTTGNSANQNFMVTPNTVRDYTPQQHPVDSRAGVPSMDRQTSPPRLTGSVRGTVLTSHPPSFQQAQIELDPHSHKNYGAGSSAGVLVVSGDMNRILEAAQRRVEDCERRLINHQNEHVKQRAALTLEIDKSRWETDQADFRLAELESGLEAMIRAVRERIESRVSTIKQLRVDNATQLNALIKAELASLPPTHGAEVRDRARTDQLDVLEATVSQLGNKLSVESLSFQKAVSDAFDGPIQRVKALQHVVDRHAGLQEGSLASMHTMVSQFKTQTLKQLEELKYEREQFEAHFKARVERLADIDPRGVH